MLEEDFFWGNYCEGVAFGDTKAANSYGWGTLDNYDLEKGNSFYSFFDTGASALMISALYYEAFIYKIFEKVPEAVWTYQNGMIYTDCDQDYPNLYFMFDGRWIEVASKDYVIEVDQGSTQCVFFIVSADLPMNILGMPIFVDYYTVHDPKEGTIGFAPHSTSYKKTLERA